MKWRECHSRVVSQRNHRCIFFWIRFHPIGSGHRCAPNQNSNLAQPQNALSLRTPWDLHVYLSF